MNTWLKVVLTLVSIFVIGFIGWLIGRDSVEVETITKTEYLPGEPVEVEVKVPVPVKVTEPVDTADIIAECVRNGLYFELFPEKVIVKDSIIYVPDIDTTEIVKDWATERYYEETLFDNDTSGTCTINLRLQYNRLRDYKYKFTPMHKVVDNTVEIKKKYEPFVGAGISTMPTVTGQAGLFINHLGFSYQYQYDWVMDKHIHGINVLYKF